MTDKIKAKATMQGSSAAAALAPPADGYSRHQGDPRQNPPGAARKNLGKCGEKCWKTCGKRLENGGRFVGEMWKKMVGLTILAGHGHDGLSAIKKTSSKSLFQLAGRWHVDHSAHAKMVILAGKNNRVQCAA